MLKHLVYIIFLSFINFFSGPNSSLYVVNTTPPNSFILSLSALRHRPKDGGVSIPAIYLTYPRRAPGENSLLVTRKLTRPMLNKVISSDNVIHSHVQYANDSHSWSGTMGQLSNSRRHLIVLVPRSLPRATNFKSPQESGHAFWKRQYHRGG
jgi:hypothetical protein